MNSFDDLVISRRKWIDDTLMPWCKSCSRKDLLLAEHEWTDIAGRPSPEMTLWKWAWERFPVISQEALNTINETNSVVVTCQDGRVGEGFPDAQRSQAGLLVLINPEGEVIGPFAIDEILSIELST